MLLVTSDYNLNFRLHNFKEIICMCLPRAIVKEEKRFEIMLAAYFYNHVNSIYVLNGVDGLGNINPDLYECIIFEKSYFQNNEESMYDEIAFFEGKRYELRVVTGILVKSK